MAAEQGAGTVVISARIEEEISQLDTDEQAMFLEEMGLEEAGLDRLIRAGYELLGLRDLLHRRPEGGPRLDDPRGHAGAAGGGRDPRRFRARLHPGRDRSPMTITSPGSGEAGAKEAGKMRVEGKGYEVKDGDVMHFLFNA